MQDLFTLSALAIAAIPIDLGLVQIGKNIGLTSNWAPVASIAIGVGLVALTGATWQADLAQGIIVGLAASGLYSGGKQIVTG